MLLFIFLVIALVALIIFFAILTVKKKNPEFVPPEVKEEPDLNKLDHLVSSVKRPKEEEKTGETTDKGKEERDSQEAEEKQTGEEAQKNKEKEEEQDKKQRPGTRGTPPKKPPTINLKEAMRSKQFLDRKS